MQFAYKVINEEMMVSEGILEAVDYEAAKRLIRNNGWQIISIDEPGKIDSFFGKKVYAKVKYESISAFCSQLAMMIRSGANLVRGLEILQSQLEDKRLKQVVEVMVRGVSRGDSLSQAMRESRGALPDLLINLVAVGEQSGSLDSVLASMAEYYERENFLRKKVSSAATYPIILTVVLIGLVILFIKGILPEITDLFTSSGQALPLITRIVLESTKVLEQNFLFITIGVIFVGAGLGRLFQIPKYRYYLDRTLLGLPLFGKNLKNMILARFCRTLALFLHSSIPIVPILNSIETIMGNEVPRLAIANSRERIIRGETLAHSFGQEPFFDALVIQMISIGEETGRLEELMSEVANHYDKRVEIGISRMTSLIEPVFTLVVGIFAGILIISIALPIFSMADTLK